MIFIWLEIHSKINIRSICLVGNIHTIKITPSKLEGNSILYVFFLTFASLFEEELFVYVSDLGTVLPMN